MRYFYILSVYHSHPRDRMLTWWGKDSRGYVFDLNSAGRFTEEEALGKIHDGGRNIAVPCELADQQCQRVFIWEPHLFAGLGDEVSDRIKKGCKQ